MKSKELPICIDPPIKFFLHHALPLAMILVKGNNFLYSNYIQLCKSSSNDYLFDIYPRIGAGEKFGDNVLDNVLDNCVLSGDILNIKKDELISLIIGWINNDYYVQVATDERMIAGTRLYQAKQFRCHQAFYFGYDLEKKVLKMLNYDTNSHFTVIDVCFDDVSNSFKTNEMNIFLNNPNRCIKYKDYTMQLRKLKNHVIEYNYTDLKTTSNIKLGLEDYLGCKDSTKNSVLKYPYYEDCVWGVNVYKYIKNFLIGEYKSRFGFQCICGLLEHKRVMNSRIIFLNNLGFDITKDIFNESTEVIKNAEILRNLFLKSRFLNDTEKKNYSFTEKYLTCLEKIEQIEENMLQSILDKINKGI